MQRRCRPRQILSGASPGERLAGTRSSQPGGHYRCTNTLSIVHTGRPTSISSAKITHHTISVAKSSQTSAICNCYCPKKEDRERHEPPRLPFVEATSSLNLESWSFSSLAVWFRTLPARSSKGPRCHSPPLWMLATSTAMRPQRQAQLLQRNIEQRLGGVRQHPDATES